MKIIVPATSANIGPGFDSVGVALSKYLEIEVLEESQEWVIEHDLNPRIPKDRRNLLVFHWLAGLGLLARSLWLALNWLTSWLTLICRIIRN